MVTHGFSVAFSVKTDDVSIEEPTSLLPSDNNDILGFSRNGKNIVVFMLDMFTGGYAQTIFDKEPELIDRYDGFVWYPNTLSTSTFTNSSIPAMLGGWKFAPENINADMDQTLLIDKIANSYEFIIDEMHVAGYIPAFTNPCFYHSNSGDCEKIKQRKASCVQTHQYSKYWKTITSGESYSFTGNADGKWLNMVSLFKAVPFAYKNRIYDNGNWIIMKKTEITKKAYKHAVNNWGFLDMMPQLSNIDVQGNTFKFFQNKLTHLPYAMSKTCIPLDNEYPDPSAKNNTDNQNPYYSARCAMLAIADFLSWLNENGIYDNTKIILVSDHGNPVDNDQMRPEQLADNFQFSIVHALLMVKDFNSHDSLVRDNRFLSNADTPAIICSSIGGCNGIEEDPTIGEPMKNRVLTVVKVGGWSFEKYLNELANHVIKWKYEVRDNMFDANNWKNIKLK